VFNTLGDARNDVSNNPPWTFTFLIYLPGVVTTTVLTQDVMTGPMSGCYLFKYAYQGARMAHVGTESSPGTTASKAAKTAWKALAARNDVSDITGASPFHASQMIPAAGKYNEPGHILGPPVVYGYFASGAARAYAIELALVSPRLKAPKRIEDVPISSPVLVTAAPPMRVLRVLRMGLAPWRNLSLQPTFQ
jgi:hypothetical protein